MKKPNFKNIYWIILLSTVIFSNCSVVGSFTIENKTDETILIEIIPDSLNLRELITNDILSKKGLLHYDRGEGAYITGNKITVFDSVNNEINTITDTDVRDYFFSEINMNNILLNFINYSNNNDNEVFSVIENDTLKAIDYYNQNLNFIDKILKDKVITIMLPPNTIFGGNCISFCGDCGCSGLHVIGSLDINVITEDEEIYITSENAKEKMRLKGLFRANYSLKIKKSWF